jgi:N-acetylmuramoyl-L-alanine amidase
MDARARATAFDREQRPECVADVPLQIKEELAEGHAEPDRPPGDRARLEVAAAAARILVDFDSSPHGGHWRPLPDSGREPAIAMQTVIHHSIVGSAEGAFQYFAGSTVIESTFIVKKSGYFWQCMSLGEQADANFRANAFAGSIETEDNGNPDRDPWTPAQIDTLVWLSLEMRRLRPLIARRKCRTWDDPGIGYHSLFPGQWTNVPGKTCPGTVRKGQWGQRVLPRFLAGAIEEDDDMTPEQARQLRAVYEGLIVPGTLSPEQTVNLMFERIRAIEDALIVPGTTTAEEAFNLLFARVRRIENLVEELAASASSPAAAGEGGIDYERLADKVAERLAGKLAE